MESIIKKIYIVVHNSNNKNWTKLVSKLKWFNIPIKKWNSVKKNNITDKKVNKIATKTCASFCSVDMISEWLTHFNLWKHIVKNEEDLVLILDENIILAKNFNNKLDKYWNQIPYDWDIVYLGCNGSCGNSTITETYYKVMYGRENEDINSNLIKPCFPLGLYAYIITYEGAKKLLKNDNFKKIGYKLDYYLAKYAFFENNLNLYAFIPALVKKKSHNKIDNHEIFKPITSKLIYTKSSNIHDVLGSQFVNIRFLKLNITYYTIIFALSSLIIGYYGDQKLKRVYVFTLTVLLFFEIAYTKTNNNKLKTLFFEIFVIFVFLTLGLKLTHNMLQ